MTEHEWFAWQYPQRLLEDYLKGKASDRKLRLLACACCYQVWPSLTDERSRKAVRVAELYADGQADGPSLQEACREAKNALEPLVGTRLDTHSFYFLHAGAYVACRDAHESARVALEGASIGTGTDDFRSQVQLPALRDIFGNPFRPVAFSPSWRTDTALTLARQMYENRDFSAMPILADALQDAGCDNDDILTHCRGDGPHVRGCWVVDLVLGKE